MMKARIQGTKLINELNEGDMQNKSTILSLYVAFSNNAEA